MSLQFKVNLGKNNNKNIYLKMRDGIQNESSYRQLPQSKVIYTLISRGECNFQ